MDDGVWAEGDQGSEVGIESGIKKQIVNVLTHTPGRSPKQIADDTGVNRSTVRVYLKQLLEDGFLKLDRGLYYISHP
jgi:DNA-binding IclR family transcriptional regulator